MVLQVGESGQRDVSQDDNGVAGHKQDLCWGTSHEKAGSYGRQNLKKTKTIKKFYKVILTFWSLVKFAQN